MPMEEIKLRAENWRLALGWGEVVMSESTVGGGSLPGASIPTWVLSLLVKSPDKALARLRKSHPAVIARTQSGSLLFDPRTVLPGQDEILLTCLKANLSSI